MDHKQEDPDRLSVVAWIRSGWKGIVPIGVAAAVALVIGGGVDFAHSYGDPRDREEERSAKPAADQDRAAPRYVVGVRGSGEALVVRDVHSGRDVGLPVAAPTDKRFQRVASVDDRSFVVAVDPEGGAARATGEAARVTFQRLRLGKDGGVEELVPLARAAIPGASAPWSDLAVAPDGDSIAYVTYRPGARPRLDVVSARTGQRKTWASKTPGRVGSLSWSGSTLSFVWSPTRKVGGKTVRQFRTLDTSTAAPGNLQASKALFKLPEGSAGTAVMNRDGRTVVLGLAQGGQLSLQAYALPAGRPGKVLWKRKAAGGTVSRLDADHTGDHLLITTQDGTLYPEGADPVPAKDLLDATW
ncbi:hypothetical protein Acsp03_56410 [Actinomadura sp. NBRC 104412]|uniref:hypothetical protein n=1 Tax=Actinomadura sp. NBRC 104412 TaxID=3032203 RepID=UPI0024A57A63|nr:hypothetical protein [Actinomadura sp. NBRC 104412]GLZ08175.1 hypothetical protein Acsp03_56410 [Actinomadura sp. NBRC 104412]